jgi:hypothetical protein
LAILPTLQTNGNVTMKKAALVVLALALCAGSAAMADEPIVQISPIFSQLVMLAFPLGFKTVFEKSNGNRYIRESVLDGETVEQWSQMITVTGARGLASDPSLTPQLLVVQMGAGFKRACPETISAEGLGALKISGQDAFMGVAACGTARSDGAPHSESALLIVLKGSADYYTIQWAERGPSSDHPLAIDAQKWTDRFKALSPIKLCPRVPGEAAPYPSCLNQK